MVKDWLVLWISIHAPTRGATMISPAIYISFVDFNPRSHKGSDGYGSTL